MKTLFEDFLREQHGDQYTGTDDDMPDNFDDWICELSGEDFIQYANIAMKELKK